MEGGWDTKSLGDMQKGVTFRLSEGKPQWYKNVAFFFCLEN